MQPAIAAGVREKMAFDGVKPVLTTPAECAKFLKADREQWVNVARSINFKADK